VRDTVIGSPAEPLKPNGHRSHLSSDSAGTLARVHRNDQAKPVMTA
jgi:hypothetical protein